MKQKDIQKCVLCGEGIMHGGNFLFYTVSIERHIMDPGAVQRQHGLEMTMGGAAVLANIMGPDEDMSKSLGKRSAWICHDCAVSENLPVAILDERIAGRDEDIKVEREEREKDTKNEREEDIENERDVA